MNQDPMIEIPAQGHEPRILLYDSMEELRLKTGFAGCHGFFDAQENTIVATRQSIAHEIGHYHDFRTGGLKPLKESLSPEERIIRRIRNEIVAILYSYLKCGPDGQYLPYERDFLEWFEFQRKRNPKLAEGFFLCDIERIQKIATLLTDSTQTWIPKLEALFDHYLREEKPLPVYELRDVSSSSL